MTIAEQICEKIVGFGLKAPNLAKMMLMAYKKIRYSAKLNFPQKSKKIAQIHDGRQYLCNKKLTMHISIYLKEGKKLLYHIIRLHAKF